MGGTTKPLPSRRMRSGALFGGILRDQRGVVAIIAALAFPVLAGFGMLGADAAVWYWERRDVQSAADAAALAGALHIGYGHSASQLSGIATRDATSNGYDSSRGTITVRNPPASGPSSGDSAAVEVEISQELQLFYARVVTSETASLTVRATAVTTTADEFCLLSLSPDSTGVNVSGGPDITMNCGIASNSNDACAVSFGGSASIDITTLSMTGDMCTRGSPTVNTDSPPRTGRPPVNDPYADLEVPAHGPCDHNNASFQDGDTMTPGVYCGNTRVGSNANVTVDAGEYFFDGGSLTVNGGASLDGSDVSMFFTGSGSDYATFTINGGASLNLSAPTTGSHAGVVMMGDPDAPEDTNRVNGGATLDLAGVMYFPTQTLDFRGGADMGDSCVQVVGKSVDIGGDFTMNNQNCDTAGTRDIGSPVVRLVR